MIKIASNLVQNGAVAIVHHTREQWSVLIAGRTNGRPAVREATSIRTQDRDGLEALLERHSVQRVICVLPTSAVVCRTCTLPNADDAQLLQALDLQVESHSATPEHRTSMGLLPAAPGETSRTGLVLTWPEQADVLRPPTDRDVTYAPEIAAFAALMDQHRPADPILWADPATDAVGICITHANGAMFRALRERASTTEEWRKRIVNAMAETASSVGHTDSFIDSLTESCGAHMRMAGSSDPVLMLPEELIDYAVSRLDGVSKDAHWWRRYGIAAGVLLADSSAMSAFTGLIDRPEIIKPSPIERVTHACSSPRTATMVIVAALLVLAFAPMAVSGLRLLVLNWRYPDIEAKLTAVEELKKQGDMYSALNKQSWSMTKILSDLVCNTPEGVKLDVIDLQQSGGKCTVSGYAIPHTPRTVEGAEELSPTEVLLQMQTQLDASGIFGRIDLDWDDTGAFSNKYEFNLSTHVVDPYHMQRYDKESEILDYARWSLCDREGGRRPSDGAGVEDNGSETALVDAGGTEVDDPPAARPAPPEDDDDDRPTVPREGPRSRGGGPGDDVGTTSGTEGRSEMGGDMPEVTEPLTEAMVRTMSMDEARTTLAELTKLRGRVRKAMDPNDPQSKEMNDRLRRDHDLLMRKIRGDL